ncbi:MAG: hypothetical protein IAE90_16060 [Ignavibacteria bacterium]|nr:hypothetical protein [Ignavibacteria bacterium]
MIRTVFFTIVLCVFFIFSGCSDDTPTNTTTGGPLDGKWKASEVQMVHAPSGSGHSAQMKAQLQLLGSLPAATVGWANLNFGSSRLWNSQTIGTQSLGRIKFINDMVGMIYSSVTEYFLTTDGGVTWNRKIIGSVSYFYLVSIVNANIAYAVGHLSSPPYSNVLLKSTDGGSTWAEKFSFTSVSVSPNDIGFVNEETGYAIANGKICKTTNGGLNWAIDNTPMNCQDLQFFNDQSLIISGMTSGNSYSSLLKTSDGGTTWQTIPLNFLMTNFDFKDENTGFASGILNSKIYIFKTIDGGFSWSTILNMSVDYQQGFHFLNASTGMAVDGSAIIRTEDGGITWTQEFCDYYSNYNGVYLKDSQNGLVTDSDGRVWMRSNITADNCWSLGGKVENTSIADIIHSRDEVYYGGGTYSIDGGNITFTVLGYSATGGDAGDFTIGGGTFTSSGNLVLTLNFANDEQWKVTFIR